MARIEITDSDDEPDKLAERDDGVQASGATGANAGSGSGAHGVLPDANTQGERGTMAKQAGVGARYVLVFQDGSRHPFNMVPGRKFTIGQIMWARRLA